MSSLSMVFPSHKNNSIFHGKTDLQALMKLIFISELKEI